MDEYEQSDLVECDNCGRKFASDVLQRHRPICLKSSQKKRRVFDMSKKRAEGTELVQFKPQINKKQQSQAIPVKQNNWKSKHEEFIRTIRNARGVQRAMDNGLPLPPPPPPTINPDYVQCDYCGRRFKDAAAERHIPFCREQHQRKERAKPDQKAVLKQAIRTQYQPPKPASKAQSQESYSANSNYGRKPVPSAQVNAKALQPTRGGYSQQNVGTRVPSGQILRTGRTEETYTEARQLSASQRSNNIGPHKFPVKGSQSQYTGTGLTGPKSLQSGNYQVGRGPTKSETFSASRGPPLGRGKPPSPAGQTSFAGRFCYDCGAKFPTASSRFCCECGAPKVAV